MSGARNNMQGHVTLTETTYAAALDEMKTPADYQNAGGLNLYVILVPSWTVSLISPFGLPGKYYIGISHHHVNS